MQSNGPQNKLLMEVMASAALSIYRERMHILITLTNAIPKAPRGLGRRLIRDLLNTFHLQLHVLPVAAYVGGVWSAKEQVQLL